MIQEEKGGMYRNEEPSRRDGTLGPAGKKAWDMVPRAQDRPSSHVISSIFRNVKPEARPSAEGGEV